MKVNFSVQDIVDIHNQIILEFGGDEGVVSISSLDFIIDFVNENKFDEDFFTLLAKILRAITIDHPFVDGNKRTGLVIIQSILEDNKLILNLSEKGKEEFILSVAKLKFNLNELKLFLENNSVKF